MDDLRIRSMEDFWMIYGLWIRFIDDLWIRFKDDLWLIYG